MKKRIYHLWKEGQVTWEDYKDVTRSCRKKIKRDKAQLELHLATTVKDNKKGFYKYIDSKRRVKEWLCH